MGRISGFGVVETLLPLGAAEIDDERLWPHEIFGKRPLRSVYYLGADAPFLPSSLNVGLFTWVEQCVGRV